MIEHLSGRPGRLLELDDYLEDFDSRVPQAADAGLWKLERCQTFRQPESPSWAAFARGSWDEALRALDAASTETARELSALRGMGVRVHRLRIAEQPISPYLQWEFHSLLIRYKNGEDIRVGDAGMVSDFEPEDQLPEIVVIGNAVVYLIRYSEDGLLCGAVAHEDPEAIAASRKEIARLHRFGRPLPEYFQENVANLGPPRNR